MRNALAFLTIVSFFVVFPLNSYGKKQPKIKVDNTEINLGIIDRKTVSPIVSFPVVISNEGKDTLRISEVLRDCEHCTTLDIPSMKIAPKKKMTMKVTIDYTPFFSQLNYKTITIYSNDLKNPEVEVNITADLR